MRTFLLCSALLALAACGSSDEPDRAATTGTPASTLPEITFSEDLEKQACGILTPAMVTEAAGMPASGYERSPSESILAEYPSQGRHCVYEWNDGASNVSLSQIDVHKDDARAARWFGQMTATTTRGDYQEGMKAIGDQLEHQRKEGEIGEDEADGAQALAEGMGNVLAEGDADEILSQYEPVSGIGDEAAIQEGVQTIEVMNMTDTSYVSLLWVRRGNLMFLVSANLGDPVVNPADAKRTGAATRALARAVVAGLEG